MRFADRRTIIRVLVVCLILTAVALSLSFSAPSLLDPRKGFAAPLQERGGDEYVKTYADDCATPKTVFYPGEVVCAEAGNFPADLFYRYRRFQWAAPDGLVADQANIKVDPQMDKFTIPTSGQFYQLGTWMVQSINSDADIYAGARFFVRDPRLPYVDLFVTKVGPGFVLPGDTVSYKLWVHNPGPDDGSYVYLTDEVPTNMTFAALKQTDGKVEISCSTPTRGGTGAVRCKVPRIPEGETLGFLVYYYVDKEVRPGTTSTGNSEIASETGELNKENNFTAIETTIGDPDAVDDRGDTPEPEQP
ncbi:MAG TPA: hypothetical protein VGX48_17615 [Pyrinomonadaceae bacterium]|jgi:uncharacterized repeat protein (TIGR01451 family)|nr:hypothetical protein [Pyrinomonadaceae bacterium]